MGMFDWIKFETKCPVCGNTVKNFQSKDADNNLDCLEFWKVDNFYSTCEKCKTWIEFDITEEARRKLTIEDYEMTYKTSEQREEGFKRRMIELEHSIEKMKEIDKNVKEKRK